MKRIIVIIASILLVGATQRATADNLVDNYHDLVRPNGQARSDAIFQADLNYCYGQTRTNPNAPDTPAPNSGWHWENGMRVCHNDCDDPQAPGSGYRCKNVIVLGMNMTKCVN